MIDDTSTCSASPTSWVYKFSLLNYIKRIFQKKSESNLIVHAKTELLAAGMDANSKEDGPNKWIAENILELIEVFSKQGHSGSSAMYAIDVFAKLANYKPLGPLTGEDSEWFDHGYCMQNKRCSHVFKQANRFDGQAYDLNGKVFREPNGATYTGTDSMTPIVFPYTPTTVFVDVPFSTEE